MTVSTKQQRIAELAKQQPEMGFTSLNHYLDVDWLREAYRRLRKASAPGYDGQTVADYGKDLESNLQSLLDRAKSGTYFAPPVRRVHIPKGTGNETRPIGIPATEDKLLQRAVAMILEPIYGATRPCGPTGIGGCDAFMKLCLSSSGCESRPAKGEPARVGSKPCASSRNGVGDA